MYVYAPVFARQRLGKHVPDATNTHVIVGHVVFYAVSVVS
jgi:hypothetical protein